MKILLGAIAVMAGLVATDASAQGVNLTGRRQCVALCVAPSGNSAFITQNGWQLNMVSDAGVPSRAWVNYPGRIHDLKMSVVTLTTAETACSEA
jgi:hypothetical protein